MSVLNPILPTEHESKMAGETGRKLAAHFQKNQNLSLQVVNGQQYTIELPASAIRLLIDILNQMARGNAITIMPMNAELTTQQAADFLNVSRPFLVGLLESGVLPFRKVGTHRRIQITDLIDYKNEIDEKRKEDLKALQAQAQELNLGY